MECIFLETDFLVRTLITSLSNLDAAELNLGLTVNNIIKCSSCERPEIRTPSRQEHKKHCERFSEPKFSVLIRFWCAHPPFVYARINMITYAR